MEEQYNVFLNNEFLSHEKKGEFHIDVADLVEQIEIILKLDSKQWCQLTIHDKAGPRGQVLKTHEQEKTVAFIGKTIQTTTATMITGDLPKGVWRVTYEIEGETEEQSPLFLEINQHQQVKQTELEMTEDIMENPIEKNKTGWVRGDLHTHTIFSDGRMTREANLKSATKQQLEFFVATDHQVVTHHWPMSDIAVYAGVELTTPLGHANFLGVNQLLITDYQIDQFQEEKEILATIQKNKHNGLFSVNHPFLKPWDWQLGELPLSLIDSMEICNDPTFSDNQEATEKALNMWSVLWNDGWKIAGVGGSDSHLLPTEKYPESDLPSLIGDPATFVYVNQLNQENLLKGIKLGKTMLSRIGKIEFNATDDEFVLPGQQITTKKGVLEVSVETGKKVKFEWILDGSIVQTDLGESAQYSYLIESEEFHWLRVDIRSDSGEFLGTITPVYWNGKLPTFVTWEEACHELN